LFQQGLDMRGVVDVFVGQIPRGDFAAVGIDADVQLAPSAASKGSALLKQPFAGAAKLQSGAVDDQVKRARPLNLRQFVNLQPVRPSAERRVVGNR